MDSFSRFSWWAFGCLPHFDIYESSCREYLCTGFCVTSVFCSFGYMPTNDCSCGKGTFNPWRICHLVFETIVVFYISTGNVQGLQFPRIHAHTDCTAQVLMIACSVGVKSHLTMVWVCMSLMTHGDISILYSLLCPVFHHVAFFLFLNSLTNGELITSKIVFLGLSYTSSRRRWR